MPPECPSMARLFVTLELPFPALERLAAEHEVDTWPGGLAPPPEDLRARTSEADGLLAMVADHQAWAAELVATEELSIVGLETGHWPMFTAPQQLGELMVQALAPKPTQAP